ncbi:hypothetical protein NLJ89_g4213 [Agrocybe chaxingu]|uniref:Uncharacterized protein n=1 Tax=Agrocybe chaxingu TaxID=84603 RepID=A0A9W8K0Y3_9AGAR|nr:hypothetical protein NLJ89_g4213 [Agrocybe chaxingu]
MLFRARFSPTGTRTPTPLPPASPTAVVQFRNEDPPPNAGPSTSEAPSPISYRNSMRTSMSVPVNESEDGENAEASELPPPYDVARTPDHPVTYTFSRLSVSNSSMLLVPPSDAADQQPLYHIAVGFDPFNPGSIITSVRKGGTENGEYVGGIRSTSGPATFRFEANAVSIRKHEYPLFRIFSKFSVSKGVEGNAR